MAYADDVSAVKRNKGSLQSVTQELVQGLEQINCSKTKCILRSFGSIILHYQTLIFLADYKIIIYCKKYLILTHSSAVLNHHFEKLIVFKIFFRLQMILFA